MKLLRDRSKRYEFVLDCLPRWSVILILVVILLIVGLFVIISLFASPTASITITRRHSSNGSTTVTTTNSLVDSFMKREEEEIVMDHEVLDLRVENTIVEDDNSSTGNDSSIVNNGTVSDNSTIDNNGTVSDNSTIDNNSTVVDNTTSFDNNGTVSDNSTIDNNGTVADNSTIDNNSTVVDNTTSFDNNGTVVDNSTTDNNGTIVNNGTADNNGTTVSNGTVNNSTADNNGTVIDYSNHTTIDNTTSTNSSIINNSTDISNNTINNSTDLSNNTIITNGTIISNETIITNGTTNSTNTTNPGHDNSNNGTTTNNSTEIIPPTYMEEIFTGKRSIIDTFNGISIYAMEFKYILKLNPVHGGSDLFGGAIKDDLKVRVYLYGRNSDSEDWTMVNSPEDSLSTHGLICAQTGYLAILQSGGCTAITLFHSRVIRYSSYKMNLTILNLEKVYRSGLLENTIETGLQSNNPQYSMYELGFRMTFSVLSILHWIAFLVVTFWSQQLRNWHTAQKWLVVLLFLHFWYHDPLYPAMMWTGWEGFPIVDIILSVTFVYGFLLYLLIFFHSVFKAPQDRTFLNFYLTKIIIVGIGYILTLILMIWSRVYNVANPSSVDISSVPGYAYLVAANVVFLVLWGIDLAYYIFRAMGAVGKLKSKYSSRFRVVGSFSFIVAACFIGLTIAGNGFRTDVQSLTFLLLHGIVYVYFASLSFLLMPGKNEEKKPEPGVSAREMDTNDKNDFTKPSAVREADDDEVQITDVVLSRNDEDF